MSNNALKKILMGEIGLFVDKLLTKIVDDIKQNMKVELPKPEKKVKAAKAEKVEGEKKVRKPRAAKAEAPTEVKVEEAKVEGEVKKRRGRPPKVKTDNNQPDTPVTL